MRTGWGLAAGPGDLVIPTDPLSPDDVRERAGRHLPDVAHHGDALLGCSTVRPPAGDGAVTVLAEARRLGAEVIETVVLESNGNGPRFALARGFVEVECYLLPGDSVPYVDLRLT
ncbi:GNAT family N-acetyltransferase [Streptomyces sp. NPDC059851]|uniref:GNAT family N-acetyltransferase n=1 Tax=Streptomyces sp. NPDC059851 TaxID=3346971 RepID=UPI00364BC58D